MTRVVTTIYDEYSLIAMFIFKTINIFGRFPVMNENEYAAGF